MICRLLRWLGWGEPIFGDDLLDRIDAYLAEVAKATS